MLPAYAGMIRLPVQFQLPALGAPRIRGDDPGTVATVSYAVGVLPAYAGMIPCLSASMYADVSAPRIRGDDPRGSAAVSASVACSPHTRG